MLMFVTQPGSRRQYDFDKDTGAFLQNLLLLAEIDEEMPRQAISETADDLLQKIHPEFFRQLRTEMVRSLIRSKQIGSCKYGRYWRLVADGTGLYTFKHRHCEHCQTKKSSSTGEVTYFHNVLEFKLVSPEGLAISLDSEFIVNIDGETKQDSELKAFYRAAPRIKRQWPCMEFLLLGDGIYANANVMELCHALKWKYCLSLKDNLPTLKAEAEKRLQKAKVLMHAAEDGVEQELRYVENLRHAGHLNHVLQCKETKKDRHGECRTTNFLWITDLHPSWEGPENLANSAARQRWKIENQGFNSQKNGGFNIEHGYGVTGHAWQNYYLIAQIVHIIIQMATRTDAIHKLPRWSASKKRGRPLPLLEIFGSMRNFIKRLAESFRFFKPSWRNISELDNFQLRFLDST